MTEVHEDLALLKVKGNIDDREERKNYVKSLAQAVGMVVQKHGVARLRCVGAASVSNAVKSHIIANGEASKKGSVLVCVPSFKTVVFEGAGEKTAIVLEVKDSQEHCSDK